jgi:hypothetical protein
MKIRHVLNEISKNLTDGWWWRQRFISNVVGPSLRMIHGDGVDFMKKDWDNLLILDACRADMWESTIDEEFDHKERIESLGSSSPDWMKKSFKRREFPDTVYVSANPWISKIAPNSFHHLENIWIQKGDIVEEELLHADHLGETSRQSPTIFADEVNEVTREVHKQHPNKRLIIHYFQPHAPCVGNPDGTRLEEIRHDIHPGDDLKKGNVDRDEVWRAYEDNLEYVFHHASQLADELDGKSVFTADHGELFGEWMWPFPIKGYAHPSRTRHPDLVTVPWAVRKNGDRREIQDGTTSKHRPNEEMIDERLKNLGYKV